MNSSPVTAISSEQMRAIDTADLAGLSTSAVHALSSSQLGAMTTGQLAALGSDQLQALGSTQLRGLSSAQLVALSTDDLNALTTGQIAALSTAQAANLNSADLAARTANQLRAFSTQDIVAFGTAALGARSSAQVTLPASGYIRQAELIGVRPVTEEQAAGNRGLNRRVVRPRPGKPGMIPMSSATLWRAVKAGKFPAPIKLSERVTAWELAAVVAWLRARSA